MTADPLDIDAQDVAEAFDEDNVDGDDAAPDGHEFKTFEELPEVFDETARLGDGSADGRAYDESEFRDGLVEDEDLESDPLAAAEADPYGSEEVDVASNEVELEFTADVEGRRGAQGSAAHFESRAELSDADLQDLGYQDRADKES